MKYEFINSRFTSNETKNNTKLSNELSLNIKGSQRRIMSLSALIFGILIFSLQILQIILTNSKGFCFIYVNIFAIATYFIIGVLFIILWRKEIFFKIFKWIVFSLIYFTQFAWILFLTIESENELTETINLLILFIITGFYLAIFFKFNFIFIYIICALNIGLTIFFHAYGKHYDVYFILNLVMCIITPAVCIISRKEYNRMVSLILSQINSNKQYLNYIDILLDQIPYFYLTVHRSNIVYTNNTMKQFLEFTYKKLSSSSNKINLAKEYKKKGNLITNEDNCLIIDNENNNNDNKCENTLAKNFLAETGSTFLEENIKRIMEKTMGTAINFEVESPSLLNVINTLHKYGETSGECIEFEEGKFYHLGISKYSPKNLKEDVFLHIHFRWVKHFHTYWLEFVMSDVTLTQKIGSVEEYYQMKETLLTKLAHEFKTPLIGIIGLSEELEKGISQLGGTECSILNKFEEVKPKISYIYDLSNYVLFLINDVINYMGSKTFSFKDKMIGKQDNEHKITIDKNYFKLKDTLEFCFRILRTLLTCTKEKIKYIEPILEAHIEDNFVFFSDHFRIKQILMNLISNAVKFTKSGFIKIQAKIKKSDHVSHEEILKISLEDTGTGIHSNDLKDLLVKDKMLVDTIHNNNKGSGIGLSVSHRIAVVLGGELKVVSEYGKGSKFTLTLPVEKGNNQIQSSCVDILDEPNLNNAGGVNSSYESEINSDPTIRIEDINLNLINFKSLLLGMPNNFLQAELINENKKKILIIDDNDLVLKSIESLFLKIFDQYSIENTEIIKGYDGIDLLKEIMEDQKFNNSIVCSFVDENMEYLDGSEAIKIIRALESKCKIKKCFICKISSMNESNELNLGYECDYFLDKPLIKNNVEILLKTLNVL